jgi:hypothetical protein
MAPDEIASGMSTTLVRKMCEAKLEPLTKAGAIAEGMKNLGWGAVCLVIGLVGSVVMFTSDMSYAEMGRTLGTFGWLGLLFIPMLPAIPYLFVLIAVGGVGLMIHGAVRASAGKAMGTFEFSCPTCQRQFPFTRSRRRFEIVCPDCYTLIRADKSGTPGSHHCNYCGLTFFGPADTPLQCPGCRYKEGARQTSCAKCKKAVPRNVLFCRECQAWIGLPETYLGSLATPTTHYDVGCFSPETCRAYARELEGRIGSFADGLAKLGAAGSIPMQSMGATLVEIESSLHLLDRCALTVQWLSVKNERLPDKLLGRLADHVLRIDEALQKLRESNSLREKHERQFFPVVAEARATFAAGGHLPA